MMAAASNVRLSMDDRMLFGPSTGVGTYARALRTAQRTISPEAQLLGAGDDRPTTPTVRQTMRRDLRALARWGQHACAEAAGMLCPDVYGLAHAYFTLHRRLMPIRAPDPPGVMHWSYPLPARLVGWTNLYTVHDLIPLTHPDLTPIAGERHRRILGQIARSGGGIITVSEASRLELAALPRTADVPTWNCSQPVEAPAAAPAASLLPAGLVSGGYLLVCGSIEPRKNIARIVAAYRRSGVGLPLVVSGPDGWRADTISPRLNPEHGVLRLPYQKRSVVLALIAHTRALIFPSLAEGFGLPVIEAMAMGSPVLTSHAGALAEVAGGAAHLVDPHDEAAIASGMRRLADDDGYRSELAARGRTRAAAFTAERFTARLARAYSEAARRSGLVTPETERHAVLPVQIGERRVRGAA